MDEIFEGNKHYIKVREDGAIIDGFSDGPHSGKSSDGYTLLRSDGGYQFRLHPGGEENPALWDMDGIPLYKWVNGKVVLRSEKEIEADRILIPEPEPTEIEKIRADIDFIAAISGVEL